MSDIKIDLLNDWTNILKEQLINYGYNIDPNEDNENICIMFFNLQKRLIPNKKRKVLYSGVFSCPPDYKSGLDIIIKKIENGGSLLPHLSKLIKDITYNDPMLNGWGVYHLHLGTTLDSDGFIKRTGPLLYARFDNDNAYLINVYEHGAWTKQEIIKIIHRNWPKSIESFLLKGVIESEHKFNDNDLKDLRNSHINTFIEVENGVIYAPLGWGSSLSGVSTQAVLQCNHYARYFKKLETYIKENVSYFKDKIEKHGLPVPEMLDFKLDIDNRDIYVIEINSKIAFKMGTV